jgi:hypothetical protein
MTGDNEPTKTGIVSDSTTLPAKNLPSPDRSRHVRCAGGCDVGRLYDATVYLTESTPGFIMKSLAFQTDRYKDNEGKSWLA